MSDFDRAVKRALKKLKRNFLAALKGVLAPRLAETVNYVNAEQMAQGRGIAVRRPSCRETR